MQKHKWLITSSIALLALALPLSASASSAAIQSLSPGASVMAKNKLTFSIITTGFTAQSYQLADSFSGSTVSVNDIDGGGNFSWVPLVSDVGEHIFTVTSHDYNGNSASISQTITVLSPPSVSIQSLSPGSSVMPGTQITFKAVSTGFTNPTYIVGDDIGGSGVGNSSVDSSGNFAWTPDISQNGKHRITVYANDTLGHSASASVDVQVGAGPKLLAQLTSTSTTVSPGQFVAFTVYGTEFTPSGYSVSDSFPGTTVSNANINASGAFWWSPNPTDAGSHVLIFIGQVGAFGDKASTTQTVTVLGPGGTLPQPAASANISSSTVLSTLQAQLAALMAKMGQANTAAPAANSGGFIFNTYLKPRSRSDEVLHLQNVLKDLGLLNAEPNGYYGAGTTAAVEEFQKQHGLEPLGVVGPGTRAALNALGGASTPPVTTSSASGFKFEHFMGYGDDDAPDVTELQKRMQAEGYLSASAPLGFFGTATENAVKKFQSAHGLPAVGYCDKETRDMLNK